MGGNYGKSIYSLMIIGQRDTKTKENGNEKKYKKVFKISWTLRVIFGIVSTDVI